MRSHCFQRWELSAIGSILGWYPLRMRYGWGNLLSRALLGLQKPIIAWWAPSVLIMRSRGKVVSRPFNTSFVHVPGYEILWGPPFSSSVEQRFWVKSINEGGLARASALPYFFIFNTVWWRTRHDPFRNGYAPWSRPFSELILSVLLLLPEFLFYRQGQPFLQSHRFLDVQRLADLTRAELVIKSSTPELGHFQFFNALLQELYFLNLPLKSSILDQVKLRDRVVVHIFGSNSLFA